VTRPVLLIHGAYQGGWIWREVAARLRATGHRVLAPSLDGCAERRAALRPGITTESQAAELAGLLFHEDLDGVVAVGTSVGGMVLCKTAELARARIARLVWVDALALRDGERLAEVVQRRPGARTELAAGPTREDAETRLFAELDPATRAWALARYSLHPVAALEAPVMLPDFWNQRWDATVIHCRRSPNPPEPHQRRTAETLGARWHQLDTGHYPMLSAPDALAALIAAA
jgi:pimeloyl-ACP methyl ester carboxylesterase